MPSTIPADHDTTVPVTDPPEPAPGPPPGEPRPPSRSDTSPQPVPQAHARDASTEADLSDQPSRSSRSWPRPRVNANVVIGALITVIGALIIAVLSYGIHTVDTRFDDVDADISDLAGRLDSVESEITGLRQDVNYNNTRLDVLIGVLEATQAIPADVVPKSTAAPPPRPS